MAAEPPVLRAPADAPRDGWFSKLLGRGARAQLLDDLRRQLTERGSAPDALWAAHDHDQRLRAQIQTILRQELFPGAAAFHPHDPLVLLCALDSDRCEDHPVLLAIDDLYYLGWEDGDLTRWRAAGTTFIDLLHEIESVSPLFAATPADPDAEPA